MGTKKIFMIKRGKTRTTLIWRESGRVAICFFELKLGKCEWRKSDDKGKRPHIFTLGATPYICHYTHELCRLATDCCLGLCSSSSTHTRLGAILSETAAWCSCQSGAVGKGTFWAAGEMPPWERVWGNWYRRRGFPCRGCAQNHNLGSPQIDQQKMRLTAKEIVLAQASQGTCGRSRGYQKDKGRCPFYSPGEWPPPSHSFFSPASPG